MKVWKKVSKDKAVKAYVATKIKTPIVLHEQISKEKSDQTRDMRGYE